MCQLSSTATICESCRHLIDYTSNKTFCSRIMDPVTSGLSMNFIDEIEERACLEEPADYSSYVDSQFCKRCEPDGEQGNVEV
ncbi:uncharacterized protein FTJAE_2598 [Fusarium tjaetaba]|uniref:Uncharacterized protein n=1 Tax=Fusarium tjaetaba TaxID=1567544 RepID=A0A8H5W4U7_9HYPO|nr:uncharacterized protein FTJAE_2598 [Fusarium tjaetaba]KAF5644974.1 hypothetical protein FTJAE_2598 [Fusarium tjaetaba]